MDLMEVVLKGVAAHLKKRMEEKGFAEVVFRDSKGRIQAIKKMAIGAAKGNEGGGGAGGAGALGKWEIALQAANLIATIVSAVIICDKLNKVNQRLDSIQRDLGDLKDINFETQIALPCRELIGDYKLIVDKLNKGKPVSEKEFAEQIRGIQNYLIALYNLRGKLPMDAVLDLMITLLPVFTDGIALYYQQYYDADQGRHVWHDDWMAVFDLLLSDAFTMEVQDYLFVDLHKTNKETNEYLKTQRAVISCYKQKIEQLLSDLEVCGGTEGYQDAMQLSRQYALQQAKAIESELAQEYGKEVARKVMEQAMEEAALV